MNTITYLIDDKEGFKKTLTKKELKFLDSIDGFKAYYTLQDNDEGLIYQLEDMQGNELDIHMLNGYQREYIYECFRCFCNEENISENYKHFIKELDTPRKIKHHVNERYEIFKNYAKANQIEENNLNYIIFIDKYSSEYEKTYNESCISNPNKFDNYLRTKVLEQGNEQEDDECL